MTLQIDEFQNEASHSTASFTSSSIPSQIGLEGSGEVPLGFVLTPLASSRIIDSQQVYKEMEICTTCLAYFNLYCDYNSKTGLWKCPFCKSENAIDISSPSSLEKMCSNIDRQVVEYKQIAAGTRASIPNHLSESINSQVLADEVIMVVLDGNIPSVEINSVLKQLSKLLINSSTVTSDSTSKIPEIGLIIFTSIISIYQVGLEGLASADVFDPFYDPLEVGNHEPVLNVNIKKRNYLGRLEEIQTCASAHFGLSEKNGDRRIVSGLIDEEEKIMGIKDSEKPSRREMLRRRREARVKKETHTKSRQNANTNQKSNSGGSKIWDKKDLTKKRTTVKSQKRCTLEAISHAINVASSARKKMGRIILFTNGCCDFGRGNVVPIAQAQQLGDTLDSIDVKLASEHFLHVGNEAFRRRIGIDVFCSGNTNIFGVTSLQALVNPSGGYVLNQPDFCCGQFEHNLCHVWKETSMSVATEEHKNAEKLESTQQNNINGCVVDLRMSPMLSPINIVGPGIITTLIKQEEGKGRPLQNELTTFEKCCSAAVKHCIPIYNVPSTQLLASTLTRVQMGRFDPLATLSVMIQVKQRIIDPFVYFQFVVRYVHPICSNKLVTRVVTQRLPVVPDILNFLECIDENVVPIVLAREAVDRSLTISTKEVDMMRSNRRKTVEQNLDGLDIAVGCSIECKKEELLASLVRKDLDVTVHCISKAFRLRNMQKRAGSHTSNGEKHEKNHFSLDFAFPPELAGALNKLHHLRRGLILGTGLQSADDRALMRGLFFHLPLEEVLCMICPKLWKCELGDDGIIKFEEIPPETLVLWDNRVIAADHFDSLYVWSGQSTCETKYDILRNSCSEFLLKRSQRRFPMPQIHLITDGDSMSRRFTTRLVPSHGDPHKHQLAHYPPLECLSQETIYKLRDKFRFYDSTVDESFWKWFWHVASANFNVEKEGISLCK